jgi:predicted enzyme related to lactoylglutathione lyase
MSGEVVHFELPFDDADRAKEFYAGAFGWKVSDVQGMGYTLATTAPSGATGPLEPGAINGGLLQRGAPVTTPLITIQVDDVDAALDQIERLGGRVVVGRTEVGGMGFSAYFTDTEGNVVGLWESLAS